MRRPPRPQHHLAAVAFFAYAALCAYLASLDSDLSTRQMQIATAALKRHDGQLFSRDPVLGDSGLWLMHTPVFQGLLEIVLIPTGYQDPALPFRTMVGLVVLVYLGGMYALLYRQTRSWSVSAFVAVLSSAITYTLGHAHWGLGSLGSITPMGMCLAAVPLIVLTFLHLSEDPVRSDRAARLNTYRLMMVFAAAGLLANVHLSIGLNLAAILALAHLSRHRFAARGWAVAAAGMVAACIAALPHMGYLLVLRSRLAPPDAQVSMRTVYEALRVGGFPALYPELLKSLLGWLIYAGALIVPAAAVLIRAERFRVRDLRFWVCFILAGLFLALVGQGVSQLVGHLSGGPPPLLGLAQASALVMLPLYVLFAQALTHLFRIVRANRWLIRWGCAAAMAAWMVPAPNLRVLRHRVYEAAAAFMEEESKPIRVQQLLARKDEARELERIAAWARQGPRDAVFITTQPEFRMLARRSVAAGRDDLEYFLHLAPWRLQAWIRSVELQRELFQKPPGAEALARFRREMAAVTDNAEPWYIILPAELATGDLAGLEEPGDGQWGNHLRVFRVPVYHGARETLKPATTQDR